LINKGKVAAFVDDMLVGTETEEGHDKIVEEILRSVMRAPERKEFPVYLNI